MLGDQPDPGEVTDQRRGHDHPVADDQLAVRADDRVGHLDDLALGALGVAEHGHVEVGGAQPGHRAGPVVGDVRTGQVRGQQAGLLPRRRHEPGDLVAVLGAVADGVHVRVAGAQVVVDDHPAAYVEPGPAGQRGGRSPAGGEHDQVGREHVAVVEDEPVIGEPGGPGAGVDTGPEPAQVARQDRAGLGVDLAAQQVLAALDDLDREAAPGQRPRHLQAEQPATDHHCGARVRAPRGRAAGSPRATGTRAPDRPGGRRRGPGHGSAAGSGCCRWPGPARRTAPERGRRARPPAPPGARRPPGRRGAGRRRRAAAARARRGRGCLRAGRTAGSGCTAGAARRPAG